MSAGPTLRAVHLVSTDVAAAAAFLATVCSTEVRSDHDRARVPVGDASFIVGSPTGTQATGISAVLIDRPGSEPAEMEINGITVVTKPSAAPSIATDTDVVLDHMAILVSDLDTAAQQWEAATGVVAEMIGLHPVSNGTLRAARLEVGNRMIELISPVAGTFSPLAKRLNTHGEGPFAVALPAIDLDGKRQQLEAAQIRTLWQDPHWIVHPANPARILIQLTPRVGH